MARTPSPPSRSSLHSRSATTTAGGTGGQQRHSHHEWGDMEDEWELEEHAEAQVVTLLRHVDAALYASSASPAASPSAAVFASPAPSPSAASAAASAAAAAAPVRFPHRKPLLSYMDECSQWSAAFPHFRVDGIRCAPVPLITAVPAVAASADTGSHSSKRQSGRASRKAAVLFAQMGHAMPPPAAAATAAAAEATVAASSTAAIVAPVVADPASLTLRGAAIIPRAAPASAKPAVAASSEGDDNGGEILYIDGAGFEETLALDRSDDNGCCSGDPLAAFDLQGSSASSAYSSVAASKAEQRGMPPLTPARLAEWEEREAAKEKVWRHCILGRRAATTAAGAAAGAGGQELIRAIVAILAQAREKHQQAQAEAAKLASSAPLPSSPQQQQQDESEGDGDVLFFDGDQSMPNPFLSSASTAAATSNCSPRTAQLRALLGLDAAGNFKPAAPPRAAAETESDIVRIRMHSASASASARSRRRKQMALAFAADSDSENSDTELASSSFAAAATAASAADPFAAADAVGPMHKKSRAAMLGGLAVAAAGTEDEEESGSSFADPLSYRSPSVYSAYSLTHSSRRSRSAHGATAQGLTPNAHPASRDNPLSRSSSRVGFTPTAAGPHHPRTSFENLGWPDMPHPATTSPESTDSEEAEYEHSRGESVVAPMPPQPQPPPAGTAQRSPMSPPRRTRPLATAASPSTGGRNVTPPLQLASPTKTTAAAAAVASSRTSVATPPKPHRPSSSAAPFRPGSSRNGTSASPTGAAASNGSVAAVVSPAPAAASPSALSPQGRRVSTASASASASKQKRATVPASLPFNLALIAKQNALQQQHAASGVSVTAPPVSATATSAQMHSAAAIANSLQMRANLSSPPPHPPVRSSSKAGGAGTTPLPALRLPSVSTNSSGSGGGSAALGQMQRPHTVQSTRSGQPPPMAGANGSSSQANQDASARSVQAPSRRLTQTTTQVVDGSARSSTHGHAPLHLNSTLPPHASLSSSHQQQHPPPPLRVPRAVSALPRSSHTLVHGLSSTQQQPGKRIGVPSSFGAASGHSRAAEEKAKEVSLLRAPTPVGNGGSGGGHERSSSNGGVGSSAGSGLDAYLQRPFSSSSIRAAAHAQLHGHSSNGLGLGAGSKGHHRQPHPLSSASSSARSVAAPSGSSVTVSSTHGLVRGSHGFGVNPSAQGAAAAAKAHLAAAQAVYASSSAASSSSQHGNRSAMHSPAPLQQHQQHAPPSRTQSMTDNGSGSGGAGSSAKKKSGASSGLQHQPHAQQIAPHRPHGMAPPALSAPKNKSTLAGRVSANTNAAKPAAAAI